MWDKEEALRKFGEHVRKLRKRKGLSQDQVAANSKSLTKATISDIENGKRNPEFTTIIDLANGLDLPLAELVGFEIEEDF